MLKSQLLHSVYTHLIVSVAGSLVGFCQFFPSYTGTAKDSEKRHQNSPLLEETHRIGVKTVSKHSHKLINCFTPANCRPQLQKLLWANGWQVNDSLVWFSLFHCALIPQDIKLPQELLINIQLLIKALAQHLRYLLLIQKYFEHMEINNLLI